MYNNLKLIDALNKLCRQTLFRIPQEEPRMAMKNYDRSIFGRKTNTQKKNVRTLPAPNAVSAMKEIAAICDSTLVDTFDQREVKEGYRSIMLVLGKEDGISQLTIAGQTGLKPSTISIALKKMEREGLIARENDSKDMRMSRVYLTDEGLAIANSVYEVNEKTADLLMSGISEDELATVMAVAEKMKENYKKANT